MPALLENYLQKIHANFPPAMRIGNGQLDVAFCHMLMLPPWERALPAEDTQTLD